MGQRQVKPDYQLSDEEYEMIKNETGFSRAQIKRLFLRFKYLDANKNGFLTRDELLNIKEVSNYCTSEFKLLLQSSKLSN